MITKIVLVMHGMPPNDFPEEEIVELVKLHRILEKAGNRAPSEMKERHGQLDDKIRGWKRTNDNDPFWSSSHLLAQELQRTTGVDVIVGFNEFCGPTVDDALYDAVSKGASRVVVVTPMMTPGGEHSEHDIPETIESAQKKFKEVDFIYAWPFPIEDVASFLSNQIGHFMMKT